MKRKSKKKKKVRFHLFYIILSILIIVLTLYLGIKLFLMDILTLKYFLIGALFLILIDIVLVFIYNHKFKNIVKVPAIIIGLILVSVLTYGIYNLSETASFVSSIVSNAIKEESYNLYVLSSSSAQDIEDLNGEILGIYNNGEALEDALKELKKDVTFKEDVAYDDMEEILNAGIDEEIDAFFISSSLAEVMKEEFSDLFSQFKLLTTITVSYEENVESTDIDVTNESFIVYISGIDTYGSISTVARSDVNILVVVNPNTGQVLLVNTPRDYYVVLHSKKAYDKLTHAGIYGIDESITTLEDLYSIDIDYYVKVNFSSLVKIVDAIGSITVESKYAFSFDGYDFKVGTNTLDGAGALAFSRYRKTLPGGDNTRGENQEAVIEAILNKVISPTIITKYATILNSISDSVVTNMSETDIYKLAKYQISESPSWTVTTKNATGSDAYRTTYSAGKSSLYVMLPNETSVTEVKQAINEVLAG